MGYVHLYIGKGGGKTAAAFGVALRTLGHGKRVVAIQFLKGRKDIGEYMAQKFLPNLEVQQYGTPEFVDLNNPSPPAMKMAEKGVASARKALANKPDLLILDELALAAKAGFVSTESVLALLSEIPKETTVYITGSHAPRAIERRADFVTRITDKKRPKETIVREGIEF